jgi:Polyketide cyclase / dehydrase and lipid transport
MRFRFIRQPSAAAILWIASIAGTLAALVWVGSGSSSAADGGKRSQAGSKHRVAITRSMIISRPPQIVFAFIADEAVLPKVLTGYGPLPAVVRTSRNIGPWDQPGSSRIVHLADGNTAREQVTHYDAPNHFAYRVWDVSHPIVRSLSEEARGEWTFAPHPHGTLVTWTYTFTAATAAATILLTVFTKIFWRGYMDVCLDNAKRLLSKNAVVQAN